MRSAVLASGLRHRLPGWLARGWAALCRVGVLLLWAGAVQASPAPAVLEKAWQVDPSARWTLAQAQQAAFTPFTGILTRGYHPDSALWLRLRIDGAADPGRQDVLRIQPTWHDQIELFDPADPRPWPRLNGDRIAWAAAEHPSMALDFLLTRTAAPRDVYLRVQTVHTHMLDVQLLTMGDAVRTGIAGQLMQVSYAALLLVLLVWSLATLQLRPDRVLGAFVAVQLLAFVHAILLFGLGRPLLDGWLSPHGIDLASSTSVLLYSAAGLVFHLALLAEYGFEGRSMRILQAYLLVSLLTLGLLAVGLPTQALQLNAWVILLFALHVAVLIWSVPRAVDDADAMRLPFRWVRWFYTVFSLATLAGAIALVGLLDAHGLQLYAFLPHGFISAVVMALMLQYRARLRGRQNRQALAEQTQLVLDERRRREEQASFMAMLNHEIKTPLSIIRLALHRSPARAMGQKAVDDVRELIDKCLLLEDLDTRAELLQREVFALDVLLRAQVGRLGQPQRFDLHQVQPAQVHADRQLCETVVANLLENALKYAPLASSIHLGLDTVLDTQGRWVRLWVDNAVGRMGVPDAAQVFDKYYRAPAARSISGSGLGLYIVKRLALMHAGDVRLVVADGRVRFEFLLPC